MKRPNILYMICHDLGQELNCYGDDSISSPRLDLLAREGVMFENYFCASPPCSPSRGCIMTGRYAHSNGLIGLVNRGWSLPTGARTVVDYLNDAGYHTRLTGIQHSRKDPAEHHYAHMWRETGSADKVCDAVIEFLGAAAAASQPFYLNAGFGEVHLPFDRPHYEPAEPGAVNVPGYLEDNPDVRLELARFHGSIAFMDRHVGRVLDALDESPLRDNTVVVFTTDHGAAFPRAKSTLYEAGIGTALIMRFPDAEGWPRGGRRVGQLLNNIDLTPTLLEMAAADVPDQVQGRSFWPLLTGGDYEGQDAIFAEKNFHDSYDPMRCIRTERYKYIMNFSERPVIPLPVDIVRSIASNHLGPEADEPHPPEELYDLREDPWEQHNLADGTRYREVRDELNARLERWMAETDDPVRDGMPEPPEQQPVENPNRHERRPG